MNAKSLFHWGLIFFPDNEYQTNVQYNQDGTIEPFEYGQPLTFTSQLMPFKRQPIEPIELYLR